MPARAIFRVVLPGFDNQGAPAAQYAFASLDRMGDKAPNIQVRNNFTLCLNPEIRCVELLALHVLSLRTPPN